MIKSKSVIAGAICLLMVIAVAAFIARGRAPSGVATHNGVFCSPDGTLTDAMPIQSHRSYCIRSDSAGRTYAVRAPNKYSFSIVDDRGDTLKKFETTHTKLMHVIVVRKDLEYFQHIHPEFDPATGRFTFTDLTFPADGVYRIFADFAPGGGQKDAMGMPLAVTLSEDVPVGVGARYAPQALGSEEKEKTFDGYQVALSSDQALVSGKEIMLTFGLEQNGRPITDLQEYLGALGHSVILREGNLDFIHAHPMEDVNRPQTGEVGFMVDFPEAGRYKVFTQFQRQEKLTTTEFVISVRQGTAQPDSMQNMMHGGMPQ